MAITVDSLTHNIRFKKTGVGPVREAIISIPGGDINTDQTIATPASGNSIFIVGIFFSEDNALTLKIKYATSKYKSIELSANQGVWQPVGFGILPLQQDYPLVVQSTAALTDLNILYVEASEMLI